MNLGEFLRDRRARLLPAAGAQSRRRTPGLRREEVAARAHVSVTWYTWLEQGRGGPPSDLVLERLARALELDAAGREVLFLLAQQRPPKPQPSALPVVTPSLRRVLDAMTTSPAIVKTTTWDIVAWNDAALAVLSDYPSLSVSERNVLRRLFGKDRSQDWLPEWELDARFAVAVFRVDIARAGDGSQAAALAAELQAQSAEFRRLWADNEMRIPGVGLKRLVHPIAGPLALEYSAFSVDGEPGLTMLVFTPSTSADAAAIASLIAKKPQRSPILA
ncbi:helix-turn-helix transcriptional regulator [Variovorax sp. PCZ-1]|uniref:helix-turn-helix transcriptional regulator n=1 Tax=Variovorax sp. PCZ-1 TaxID=2835533 RepID=UPI0020C02CE7|nr:helix-turn-helix transcriptional regulator [Variovorax sp. PCZ-1]